MMIWDDTGCDEAIYVHDDSDNEEGEYIIIFLDIKVNLCVV